MQLQPVTPIHLAPVATRTKARTNTTGIQVAFVFIVLLFGLLLRANAQDGNAGVTSPTRATPIQAVDMLHTAFGKHGGRAVHAKGFILEGTFTPAPQATRLTKAAHLQKQTVPVIVRFSDFTGILDIPDTAGEASHGAWPSSFCCPKTSPPTSWPTASTAFRFPARMSSRSCSKPSVRPIRAMLPRSASS